MMPFSYDLTSKSSFVVHFPEMKGKGKVNTPSFSHCASLIPERRHPIMPEDNREPIDDPFLPLDPGDEPGDESAYNASAC